MSKDPSSHASPGPAADGRFLTTRWSLVEAAGAADTEGAREALAVALSGSVRRLIAETLTREEDLEAVHDFGQAGPWYYFVMEFVAGVDLRALMRSGSPSARETLSIVGQICDALQYAHDQGVVQRDIKPENILVDSRGRVRILDFGLSKLIGTRAEEQTLSRTSEVMGTPHYMAPEQWERPREVDHRADIYSLGVVFYELLTGELPLGRFEPPSRCVELDVRLDQVVLRTLEREPERRYQQASQVKTEISRVDLGAPPEPQAPSESAVPPTLSELFAPRKLGTYSPRRLFAGFVWFLVLVSLLAALAIGSLFMPVAESSTPIYPSLPLGPAPVQVAPSSTTQQ